jgi:uncharacterized membrane protein YgcG
MNGFFYVFFLACVCLFLAPRPVHAEIIESFTVEVSVRKDSTFTSTERIEYTFTEPRHGIFRCVPTIHAEKASSFLKERYIDIEVQQVTIDGIDATFVEEKGGGELCLKIGDPIVEITGTHVYEISYTVAGAISYPPFGGAELYWDITGNEWEVPMKYVEGRVSSPDGILLRERACYQGSEGDATSCDIRTEEDGSVRFIATLLNPREGLTIAQALNRSALTYDVRERYKPFLLGLIAVFLMLVIGGVSLYRYKTKFKTGRTIIPQYEPYPEVKPMYSGYLFDKRLDPHDITAGIVYLAEQGYIKIRKIERKVLFFFEVDDYELTLTKAVNELGEAFEKVLLTLLFGNGELSVGAKTTLGELEADHRKAQENRVILRSLSAALKEDLRKRDFFTKSDLSSIFTTRYIIAFLATAAAFTFISSTLLIFFAVALIVLAIILTEGRRTKKGYEALDHLKGFKDFLSVTEKERYIFHNAPEKNADQFMEYLPYAIAFGVEKQWAKTFEGITIPNPDWYDGGGTAGSFNSTGLTQSLGAFSTAFASASASGSSASSGGGSSGGGSGGGGGGSW